MLRKWQINKLHVKTIPFEASSVRKMLYKLNKADIELDAIKRQGINIIECILVDL